MWRNSCLKNTASLGEHNVATGQKMSHDQNEHDIFTVEIDQCVKELQSGQSQLRLSRESIDQRVDDGWTLVRVGQQEAHKNPYQSPVAYPPQTEGQVTSRCQNFPHRILNLKKKK